MNQSSYLCLIVLTFYCIRVNVLKIFPLPSQAYVKLGSVDVCRVIIGTRDLSHTVSDALDFVPKLTTFAANGFQAFDTADISPFAESVIGKMNRGNLYSPVAKDCLYLSQWTPSPKVIDQRKPVEEGIDRILLRINRDFIDLLQFHWWDYDNFYFYNAMGYLMELKDMGKIREIGVSNFNAEYLGYLLEENAPIVSNQISFSIIDTRAKKRLIPLCEEKNVSLLCHGTLLGGFLTPSWLNKAAPSLQSPEIASNEIIRRYLHCINLWGPWHLFQELLHTLNSIALKHHLSSLSVVAMRWVLQQSEAIGAVVVGSRLRGSRAADSLSALYSELFTFSLDDEDLERIASIQRKSYHEGNALAVKYEDCGNELRPPSRLQRKKYTPIIV